MTTAEPEHFSNLCFLSEPQQRKLQQLVTGVDKTVLRYKMDMQEAEIEAVAIARNTPVMPKRNPLDAGQVHDDAINKYVTERMEQYLGIAFKAWHLCADAHDRVGDLIQQQEEVKAFLSLAEAERPASGSYRWRQAVTGMPEPVRDSLNELYEHLHVFAYAPLRTMFELQKSALDDISSRIKTFETDKEIYCINPQAKLTEGDDREYIQLEKRIKDYTNRMDRIETTLTVCVENLPRLRDAHENYKETLNSVAVRKA